MKTVSEFLSDLDYYGIYQADKLAEDYEAVTSNKAGWPTHSVAITKKAIADRGLGGSVKGDSKELTAWGYEVAVSLARELVPGFRSTKFGRGSAFREAIEALKQAGK